MINIFIFMCTDTETQNYHFSDWPTDRPKMILPTARTTKIKLLSPKTSSTKEFISSILVNGELDLFETFPRFSEQYAISVNFLSDSIAKCSPPRIPPGIL